MGDLTRIRFQIGLLTFVVVAMACIARPAPVLAQFGKKNANVDAAKLDLRNRDYQRALDNVNAALSRNPKSGQDIRK